MKEQEPNRQRDLQKQHEELLRSNEGKHNRHSGLTTMSDLRERRSRRRWNKILRDTIKSWNESHKKAA